MKRAWWVVASAVALVACGGNVVVDPARGAGASVGAGGVGNGGSGTGNGGSFGTGMGNGGSFGTGMGNGGSFGTGMGNGGGIVVLDGGGPMCATSLCGMLCSEALTMPEPPCASVTNAHLAYDALLACAATSCPAACASFVSHCSGAVNDGTCGGCLMSSCPSQLMACSAN
jgi:hypothetical protein